MAMMLSPPGRFSITTGLPQRCESFSWISRAPMSAPAPGPNGITKRIGRCGQLCACDIDGSAASAATNAAAIMDARTGTERMAILPAIVMARGYGLGCGNTTPLRRIVAAGSTLLLRRLGGGRMDCGDLGALLLDGGGKLLGRAAAWRRADADHAGAEGRVGHDGGDVGDHARPDLG